MPNAKRPTRPNAVASWRSADDDLMLWTSGAHMLCKSSFRGTCGRRERVSQRDVGGERGVGTREEEKVRSE
jgi:hypothetical protein